MVRDRKQQKKSATISVRTIVLKSIVPRARAGQRDTMNNAEYEACGDCGFDHGLDLDHATQWHTDHPGSYDMQVIRDDCFRVAERWPKGCVDLVVTDPPYGKILNEGWDGTWDGSSYDQLGTLLHHILKPGATAYVWGGIGTVRNRLFLSWLSRVEYDQGLRLHNLITWGKRRAYGTAHNYLFTREECAMLVKPKRGQTLDNCRPSTFHVPLLDIKRGYAGFNDNFPAKSEYLRRTNVWTDISEKMAGKIHPAEKPAKLAKIMIGASSNPNDLVVDLFAGSGSTGVAAQ